MLMASILGIAACQYKRAHQMAKETGLAEFSNAGSEGGGGYRATRRSANYFASASSTLGANKAAVAAELAPPPPQSPANVDRKLIRNGALDLLVNDVGEAVAKIGSIVTGSGGYVEKSNQTYSGGHMATLTVRVPAAKLDPVIADLKKLATAVDRENVEVRDVTREYIDLDAHLRNAQAEEAAYLQILKRATTIKDTLDVTEKLSDVRGRIEEMQGEMKWLTSQIEMSSLEITLRSEADTTVLGIHWRPIRQAKIAVSDMLSGLADWADSVVAFFIYLPLILLWIFSILVLLVIAWRLLRFLWRKFGPKVSWRLPWPRSKAPAEPKTE